MSTTTKTTVTETTHSSGGPTIVDKAKAAATKVGESATHFGNTIKEEVVHGAASAKEEVAHAAAVAKETARHGS